MHMYILWKMEISMSTIAIDIINYCIFSFSSWASAIVLALLSLGPNVAQSVLDFTVSPEDQTGLELTNPVSTLSVEIIGVHRHTLWRQHKSSGVASFPSVCLYLVVWIKVSALHMLGKYFTTELSPQLSYFCKNAL